MEKSIIYAADILCKQAYRILEKYKTAEEKQALDLIKTASNLIWSNAVPEKDEGWVHWITSKELYITEYIGELHREQARNYLREIIETPKQCIVPIKRCKEG